MPMPMQTIVTSCGAQSGTMNRWFRRGTDASAAPTPKRAATMGRPAATAEPKTSSRMIRAATRPICSVPASVPSASCTGRPRRRR